MNNRDEGFLVVTARLVKPSGIKRRCRTKGCWEKYVKLKRYPKPASDDDDDDDVKLFARWRALTWSRYHSSRQRNAVELSSRRILLRNICGSAMIQGRSPDATLQTSRIHRPAHLAFEPVIQCLARVLQTLLSGSPAHLVTT